MIPLLPSLAGGGRGGSNSPARRQAHFPSTWRRGKEGTRGRGKEPPPRVSKEVDQSAISARGPSHTHTPFGGVRYVSCILRAHTGNLGPNGPHQTTYTPTTAPLQF
eukprot:scaffold17751_cov227-Isochrysis_galbana.AAC.2